MGEIFPLDGLIGLWGHECKFWDLEILSMTLKYFLGNTKRRKVLCIVYSMSKLYYLLLSMILKRLLRCHLYISLSLSKPAPNHNALQI